MKMFLLITLPFLVLSGCIVKQQTTRNKPAQGDKTFIPQYIPGPQALIYKTRADYDQLVPVTMSANRSGIVAYPHPSDLLKDGELTVPDRLHDGYLLDNRGIGLQTAFLNITYRQYAALTEAPSLEELMKMIIDTDPLIELCDCDNRSVHPDIEARINQAIDQKKLRSICKTLK